VEGMTTAKNKRRKKQKTAVDKDKVTSSGKVRVHNRHEDRKINRKKSKNKENHSAHVMELVY
jgi:hypothetical protein